MAITAGQRITPLAFGEAKSDTQTTAGTTTSGSYVETLTGGTACGLTFVAPLSGSVMVHNTTQIDNSTSVQTSLMSFVIREGSSIGSGTEFQAASDDDAVRNLGGNEIQVTQSVMVTGLTPGDTYNIRQAFRVSGGATATYARKRLAVIPVT